MVIVQKVVDDILNNEAVALSTKVQSVFLFCGIFYFLAWDWILGRILTLRYPYRSYTPFFCEICIATFAYGTASAAMAGKLGFLIYFSLLLVTGALWARRTAGQVTLKRDIRELCVIQSLQLVFSILILVIFFGWYFWIETVISWRFVVLAISAMWVFIFIYEMLVPRSKTVTAGPGVPFLARSDVRKLKKWLKKQLEDEPEKIVQYAESGDK